MGVCCLLMVLFAGRADLPLSLLGRHYLTCPVCREDFTTVVCTQSNTRGGVDRDLFARSLGPQPEFYRVSTCPRCGYSGYACDFGPDVLLPPDVRQKIRAKPGLPLPEGFTPESDPRELDAADRYALAITCYRWRQKPDEALAWLHLRASWIERDKGSVLPPEARLKRVMQYVERWRPPRRPTDNQVDVEMQMATRIAEALATGRFNRYQRPYVELALALILRRHGENRHASPLLEELGEKGTGAFLSVDRPAPTLKDSQGDQETEKKVPDPFSPALREGIERMRESIVREREQQRQAARCFERALLTDQPTPGNRGPACYLLAELYRRLGRDHEAIRWYDKALAESALPPDLRKWAKHQRAWSAAK